MKFTYDADSKEYSKAEISISINGKEVCEGEFKNRITPEVKHRESTIAKPLEKYKGTIKEWIAGKMRENSSLCSKICSSPDFYIPKLIEAYKKVDTSKVAKTEKGKLVPLGKVYAGKTFYFDVDLNPYLAARLKAGNGVANLRGFGTVTKYELDALAKKYPDGIKFNKQGFPDFMPTAIKKEDGKVFVANLGKKESNRDEDFTQADKMYKEHFGTNPPKGYTWHHLVTKDGSVKLILVPTDIHQLIDHAGGIAMAKQNSRQ